MIAKRIIPCLDVKNGRVVKGVQFKNHKDMGDISFFAKKYAVFQEAQEVQPLPELHCLRDH